MSALTHRDMWRRRTASVALCAKRTSELHAAEFMGTFDERRPFSIRSRRCGLGRHNDVGTVFLKAKLKETNMDLGLKGLRAVVTGGTKGIGRAAANIFAQEGASVAICARNADEVKTAVKDLTARGVHAYGADINVADRAALQKFIADSAKALCGIDILVANVSALAVQDDAESWSKTFDVDMMHTVNAVTTALPYLEKSKHPSIVIVSSVSGREVDFTGPAYGAMKAALIHYAQRIAYQHASKMIRVNTVSPGNTYFEGGVWQNVEKNLPDLFKHALSLNPTGRMATPEEIGRGIVFLASPASSFTTGTNLVIDGALTRGVQF
jgi:3-oxoacyl-[acyl-carrier protein] reductase